MGMEERYDHYAQTEFPEQEPLAGELNAAKWNYKVRLYVSQMVSNQKALKWINGVTAILLVTLFFWTSFMLLIVPLLSTINILMSLEIIFSKKYRFELQQLKEEETAAIANIQSALKKMAMVTAIVNAIILMACLTFLYTDFNIFD